MSAAFRIRYFVLGAVVACLGMPDAISAQVDPSSLPLLSEKSLQYVGGFRLPPNEVNCETFAGGGGVVAFNPANNSLFVSSYNLKLAEITIPAPVNSATPSALNSAAFLQGFYDPVEGRNNEATLGFGGGISGLVVHNNRLYGSAQIYYDSGNDQRMSHYSRSLRLDERSFTGWSSVWQAEKTGYVSGFMAQIPRAWQAKLGGEIATGQCCIPIVSRTSFGPSAFAFDPTKIAKGAVVPATPLLYYDSAHQTLGEWMNTTTPNLTYNQSTEIHGFVIIEGTRTALFVGRNGIGVPCYGKGTDKKAWHGTTDAPGQPGYTGVTSDGAAYCYDLDQVGKGTHAWPYRYQVWAYDLNDFAAVKAGEMRPWQLVPYGVWPLNLPTPGHEVRLGGAAYDAERQIVYVAQRLVESADESYRPVIHAVKVVLPASSRAK